MFEEPPRKGGWIDATGQFLAISEGRNHKVIAHEKFPDLDLDRTETVKFGAMGRGWILISYHKDSLFADWDAPTKAALTELADIIKHTDFSFYYIGHYTSRESLHMSRDAIRFVNQQKLLLEKP